MESPAPDIDASSTPLSPRLLVPGLPTAAGQVNRHRVDSSTIAAVGYDRGTAVLEMEFTSGEVYEYFLVPPSVYDGLLRATSHGRYFGDHIRARYRFRKI